MKLSLPHLGQCRKTAAGSPSAEMEATCLASSARPVEPFPDPMSRETDLRRRRAADLGTCQVYPQSVQVRV